MGRAIRAGRNDECPCGSGKKFKRCCELKQATARGSRVMMALVLAVLVSAVVIGITSFAQRPSIGAPGQVWSPEHGHYH